VCAISAPRGATEMHRKWERGDGKTTGRVHGGAPYHSASCKVSLEASEWMYLDDDSRPIRPPGSLYGDAGHSDGDGFARQHRINRPGPPTTSRAGDR